MKVKPLDVAFNLVDPALVLDQGDKWQKLFDESASSSRRRLPERRRARPLALAGPSSRSAPREALTTASRRSHSAAALRSDTRLSREAPRLSSVPGSRCRAAPESPVQPVEQQVDHRRGVERQRLRHDQPADDGDAERTAQLRARAARDHQRQRAEQRRQRRHHDRPEALEAGLVDRLRRARARACVRPRARSRPS